MDTFLMLVLMAINAYILYSSVAIVVRNSGPRKKVQYIMWRIGLFATAGSAIFWLIPAALSLFHNELMPKMTGPGIAIAAAGMIVTGILYRYKGLPLQRNSGVLSSLRG